jgi:3-oxoacyl-(acyl-carrier-protein) synthase
VSEPAIGIVASYSGPGGGTEEGLRESAREFTSRKILRFLDRASLPAFVAASVVYRRSPECDPADVAIYTVSGWDGAMPDQPFEPDGSARDDARLGLHILEGANPTGWLRMLANNALCQVSIAHGFRGPNAHLVGDAETLRQVLISAGCDLARGAAKLVLVVAFDPPPGQLGYPSSRTAARASAIALAVVSGPDELAGLCAAADRAAGARAPALDTLDGFLVRLPRLSDAGRA